MNGFTWEARRTGDLTVLVVGGDIDLATSDSLVATAATHLVSGGDLVLDCSDVTFLDSCGLRALLEIGRQASAADVTLLLRDPSDSVLRVLELSGTQDLFRISEGSASPHHLLDGIPVVDTGTPLG